MSNSLVSIITVVYNGEKYLERTILSVINQTYTNIEYIIIDGGSTDGTLDIIKKYDDKISFWISEPDKGIYDAMNKGIKQSKGELIGIINSDDWYELDCIETVSNIFIQKKDIILYGLIRNVINENRFEIYSCSPDFIDNKMPPHPTMFVPKSIYNQFGGFDEAYKSCADYDMILKFKAKAIKFQMIEKVLANFQIGGVSSSFSAKKESFNMRYKHGLISKREKWVKIIAIYFETKIRTFF